MSDFNLEDTIEDAINDSTVVDETPEVEATADDTTPEVVETAADESTEVTDEGDAGVVASPAAAAATAAAKQDDFAKKFGLQSTSVTGRENRIPYSRVKKIVERAEKEATTKVKAEVEATFAPRLAEFETKVRDYEGRLSQVAEFEQILENDPPRFLDMLSKVPAYKEFFDYIGSLVGGQGQQPAQQQSYLDASSMPQPDETLPDGTRVYSLEGLNKRDEWLARQVEERTLKAAEDRITKRYAPIEEQWQMQRRIEEAKPVIERQIAEARTWPQFNENEPAIVEALKADQSLTLQAAYMKVVMPKLASSRDDMRKSVLDELAKKPVATAAPTRATRSNPVASTGKRDLEDIIREAASGLK
jgi:hypothetical protein